MVVVMKACGKNWVRTKYHVHLIIRIWQSTLNWVPLGFSTEVALVAICSSGFIHEEKIDMIWFRVFYWYMCLDLMSKLLRHLSNICLWWRMLVLGEKIADLVAPQLDWLFTWALSLVICLHNWIAWHNSRCFAPSIEASLQQHFRFE